MIYAPKECIHNIELSGWKFYTMLLFIAKPTTITFNVNISQWKTLYKQVSRWWKSVAHLVPVSEIVKLIKIVAWFIVRTDSFYMFGSFEFHVWLFRVCIYVDTMEIWEMWWYKKPMYKHFPWFWIIFFVRHTCLDRSKLIHNREEDSFGLVRRTRVLCS